jgi:hypothetical protein
LKNSRISSTPRLIDRVAIAATAVKLRARSFTLDGEACVCGADGVAIFDALHCPGTVSEAMLYAFDLLELDGEDLRALPLGDAAAWHRAERAYRRGWRRDLPAGLQDGPGGHCVKAAERALSIRPVARLHQGQEP